MDLEDSDAEDIQPAHTSQRQHTRLRKSQGSPHDGHGLCGDSAGNDPSDGSDATSGSDQAGPSHRTRKRRCSTRAAAAVARRRLSDAAAELREDSGTEQRAESDAAADSSVVISSDTEEDQPEEQSSDEWPRASPPATAPKAAACGSRRVQIADKAAVDEESPDEWPDASPPAATASRAAAPGSRRVPTADAAASKRVPTADAAASKRIRASRADAAKPYNSQSGSDDADGDAAEEDMSNEWPDATPPSAAALKAAGRGGQRVLTADTGPNERRRTAHAAAADSDSSQSDDEEPQPDQATAQAATPGTRVPSGRRSSLGGADRVAAAGEAFRRRLAARKPPPDEAAVAAARRQSLQDAGDLEDGSGYETPEERSPPIQLFIVEDGDEDEPWEDDSDGPAGPHFHFEDDEDLPGVAEPAGPRPRRKRKKRRATKGSTAFDKRLAAVPSRDRQQQDEAGPSGAAQAGGSSEEAAAAPQQGPIVLSSDDEEQSVPARSRQQQRQRSRAHAGAELDSGRPDAAGPSAVAAQPEDSGNAGTAPDAGVTAGCARKRQRLSRAQSDDDDLQQTPPRQIRRGGPFERQSTLHDFLSSRQRQQQAGNELEDEDAPSPKAPSEQPGSSTDDFIESDEEESGESSGDEDPVPAALDALRISLGDNDRDVQLARAFAEMACGLLHQFMGIQMDRQLTNIYEKALWRIMTAAGTAGHEVSNQLGWVNAERSGVIDAIRQFTCFTTGHAFFGSGVAPDHDTEDDRDGRFTCEVCGRSTGGLRSVTFSKPCRADAESLHLHSRSTGKKRTLRRRPPSDDEAEGGSQSSRRRRRQEAVDSGEDSDADERRKFWVGSDCVQRVMLATLLKHWTCLFADKLQRVSREAILRARVVQDKKQAVAAEMAARDRFFGFWCRHLRQALGLAKKMGTWTGRSAFGHTPVPASRFASVGAEAISLRNQFDE